MRMILFDAFVDTLEYHLDGSKLHVRLGKNPATKFAVLGHKMPL